MYLDDQKQVDLLTTKAIKNNKDSICFSYLNFQELPKELFYIPSLKYLEVQNCRHFKEISEWIAESTNLENLHIEEIDNIQKLLPQLQHLKKLHCLTLAYCDFEELTDSLIFFILI